MTPEQFIAFLESIKPLEIKDLDLVESGLAEIRLGKWFFEKKSVPTYSGEDNLLQLLFNYNWSKGGVFNGVSLYEEIRLHNGCIKLALFQEYPVFIDESDSNKIKHDQYDEETITTIALNTDAFMEILQIIATMGSLKVQCIPFDLSAYIEKIIEASKVPESRAFYEERLSWFLD